MEFRKNILSSAPALAIFLSLLACSGMTDAGNTISGAAPAVGSSNAVGGGGGDGLGDSGGEGGDGSGEAVPGAQQADQGIAKPGPGSDDKGGTKADIHEGILGDEGVFAPE